MTTKKATLAERNSIVIRHGTVLSVLRSYRFNFNNEAELQLGVATVLLANKIDHQREHRLGPGDVIDFTAGDVGVECKVAGSAQEIVRQLMRYAQYESIGSLVLVTRKMQHAHKFPTELGGKPLTVVTLEASFL